MPELSITKKKARKLSTCLLWVNVFVVVELCVFEAKHFKSCSCVMSRDGSYMDEELLRSVKQNANTKSKRQNSIQVLTGI